MWQGSARTSDASSDLYCYESLAYFDEEEISSKNVSHNTYHGIGLSQSNNVSSKFTVDKEKRISNSSTSNSKDVFEDVLTCRRKIDYEKFENCISILDDDDYVKLLQSNEIIDKSDQAKNDIREDKFTSSLLNEFTKNSKSKIGKISHGSSITTGSEKSNLQSHGNWSQTPKSCDENEQQVPEMTFGMNDVNSMEEGDMDILIIKDDALCDSDSGSELDWNSLTPPVPASPSDQRVPETDLDLDFYGSDFGNNYHPAPSSSTDSFLSSPHAAIEYPSHHWYFQPQIAFQNIADLSQSENDQVVPFL